MIGELNAEHDGEVECAECYLVSENTILRYMNGRYHLRIKDGDDAVTVPLNYYDVKRMLKEMNDNTWDYTRCTECDGKV